MKRALVVGINEYAAAPLQGCVNDATDWADALRTRGFDVITLLNAQATKAGIVGQLQPMLRSAQPGDTLVFTFSGHGSWVPDLDGDEPDHRDEALCPFDYQQNLLIDDEIGYLLFNRNQQVKVILIPDSCHSGSVLRAAPPLDAACDSRRVRFLAPKDCLQQDQHNRIDKADGMPMPPLSLPGVICLSACQDFEYSYDASFHGRPNGALSFTALQCLRGLPPGGTYRDWYRLIRQRLPSQDYPQRPRMTGDRRDRLWSVFS